MVPIFGGMTDEKPLDTGAGCGPPKALVLLDAETGLVWGPDGEKSPMKKKARLAFPILAALTLAACSHTKIVAMEDGSYLALSHSASEHRAYDSALDDAKDECHSKGRKFALISQKSQYQGMDRTAKGVLNAVAFATHKYDATYGTSSSDDYRVELHFRCQSAR